MATSKLPIQLNLFQSSQKLNLSETYEGIPKDISKNDPRIKWINDNIAESVERPFNIGGNSYISEISPANFKSKKTKQFQSHFPDVREARIEYAIISLAAKHVMDIDTDNDDNKIFLLKTTYYRIQKEIVTAIARQSNREVKVENCPYNVSEIKEALEVLKKTNISVTDTNKKSVYHFTRIKDVYMEESKVVIELGNMITNYITSGDWRVTNSSSILASSGKYEIKLRVLLNTKFTYASKGRSYSPSLSFLVERIGFIENKEKRITLQKMVKVLNALEEIDRVEVDKKYDGRKIVDAIIHIYPTDEFISEMIENNKLRKRVDQYVLDN